VIDTNNLTSRNSAWDLFNLLVAFKNSLLDPCRSCRVGVPNKRPSVRLVNEASNAAKTGANNAR
jgi:hypothetical protein